MIEPEKNLKYDLTVNCDSTVSVDPGPMIQEKVTTMTLSPNPNRTVHDHSHRSLVTSLKVSAQQECLRDELPPAISELQNMKDLTQGTKDSLMKMENLNIAKSQPIASRFSNSVDECVEVQEYFQEEEIGEDNMSKGIFSSIGNEKNGCAPSSQELVHGFRILNEILSDANKNLNWPFVNPVDSTQDGCQDYYERIESPIWLLKMKEKFLRKEYTDITEFVLDMRLMIDNCLLFNGPDHSISKKAKKLETVLNQKVTLLSRDTRDKINEVIPPRNPLVATDTLEQLQPKHSKRGKDSRRRMRELQKQRMLERKLMQDHFVNTLQVWDENLFDQVTRPQMKAMWELPQLGLFLFLCSRPLNINISQYELERCFMLSRQSLAMQKLMSSIFSSANQRSKLHLGNLMKAKVWEEKMKDHISPWFKSLVDSNYDVVGVSEKLAIDEQFFKIMGCHNPFATKSFHDLTYYQKVWIVKSVCDHLLNSQKSLLDAIEKQDMIDLRPRELGSDKVGNTYFYFSQFCGDDVRIYRQSPLPTVEIGPIDFTYEECFTKKRTKQQSKKRPRKMIIMETSDDYQTPRARDSRLRQNPKQLKNYQVRGSDSSCSGSESDSEDEKEYDDSSSQGKSSCTDIALSENNLHIADKEPVNNSKTRKMKVAAADKSNVLRAERIDNLENDWAFTSSTIPRRSERKIIEESIKNAEHKIKSKTNDTSESSEKLNKRRRASKNDWRALAPFLPERNLRSKKKNASDCPKVEELTTSKLPKKSKDTKIKSGKIQEEPMDEPESDGPPQKAHDISNPPSVAPSLDSSEMTEIKYDPSDNEDDIKEQLAQASDSKDKVLEEKMDIDKEEACFNFEPTVFGPNLEEFELVAESIQDIRNLIQKIEDKEDNDLNVSCQSKGSKKNSEKTLMENLENLLKDLEPHEMKLTQTLKKARMQMRKEEEAFKEIPDIPDEEAADYNEISTRDVSSPGDSPGGDVDSYDQKAEERGNHPAESVPEVKKKNIFENDIDIALLLTEGRVLRKRNNVQPAQSTPAITRSKRLLNRPSRYKYDEYLTDDSIMASACNDDDASNHKKSEESSLATQESTSSIITSSSQVDTLSQNNNNVLNSLKVDGNALLGHQVALTEFLLNTLPCTSTIIDSTTNLAKLNIVYSAGMKSSTVHPLNTSTSLVNHRSSGAFTSANLQTRKISERIPSSNAFLPLKVAAMPLTPSTKSTPPPNHELLKKNFPSSLQNPVSIAHVNSAQTSFNSTKVLNQQSSLSILNLPSNSISPGLILLPKNFNLNQPGVIPQPFLSPMPNKPIQINPMTSNVVLNLQNLLPISNTNMNISNQVVKAHSNSYVALSPGTPTIKATKPLNMASMSLAPRLVIPLKTQIPGSSSSSNSMPPGQFVPKVGGLIPILGSNSSPQSASNMQANVSQLPLQVGQLSCENGQSIFLLANSFTQMPTTPQQKSITPAKLSSSTDSNSPTKSKCQTHNLGSQGIKPSTSNEAIVQQLVFNNLSNSNVAHQLISPGLIQVSTAQANSNPVIRCPTPSIGITIPNKNFINVFRMLSQTQKPLQLNQVTSQGK